jgi:hypothetical protein
MAETEELVGSTSGTWNTGILQQMMPRRRNAAISSAV